MNELPTISAFFPELSAEQVDQLNQLPALYAEWNSKINVVSRQDVENLTERHVLHSLAIARFIKFKPEAQILDLGTGGGFPGIPLAVFFPETKFTLVDATGKKIKVVQEVANALQLNNVQAIHSRVEDLKMMGRFDFVVTRAVAPLSQLMAWSQKLISKTHRHAYPNGLIALKGGDLRAEIKTLGSKASSFTEVFSIEDAYKRPFFNEKYVVYVQG
ncbi:MAG: 16S rRNA (guanine(527)-N(7))-methyltransferase RsmG [Saprospiraceae bacterium]|nr:16S rRNA (guanine(527)-N(7))-methyltransferase RsmG [Saprospiraceae bacterium]